MSLSMPWFCPAVGGLLEMASMSKPISEGALHSDELPLPASLASCA